MSLPRLHFRSVERMIEYNSLQPEAAAIVEGRCPLPGWPQQVRARAEGGLQRRRLSSRWRRPIWHATPRTTPSWQASSTPSPIPPAPPCLGPAMVLQGAIEVQDLVVRYRPELDPVLKGISFSVQGREKVSS